MTRLLSMLRRLYHAPIAPCGKPSASTPAPETDEA